jgi:eukaryotic-like serine/threonine-protein kinase
MACLSEDAVLEFVEGRSAPAVVAEVDVHLASCAACRSVVADVADGLSHPMKLGRYEVVRTLGVGGMGIVYEAHDPHLARRVALKVMRADHTMSDAQARALREARAMAQVSHPNVVTVHDVGVVDRQIFIAMEYVDGSTLKAFMRMQPPWRLVLDHLLQAGEGLAAAHDAGLVHRDFKPDNVLLGKDGRVRVTDFGLARLASAPHDDETPRAHRKAEDVLTTLTRTNLFVGTPAYMAPEQFAGTMADPRSDQFAFSVVLYEAIYGTRPFKGSNLRELTANALAGDASAAAPKKDEPAALRAALLKGLERDPRMRHETMRALLVALRASAGLASRRPRWVYAAIGAGLLVPMTVLASSTLWPKAGPTTANTSTLGPATASAVETPPSAAPQTSAGLVGGVSASSVASTWRPPVVRPHATRPHPTNSAHSALKPFDEDTH